MFIYYICWLVINKTQFSGISFVLSMSNQLAHQLILLRGEPLVHQHVLYVPLLLSFAATYKMLHMWHALHRNKC